MVTENRPLMNVFQEKALVLWEIIIRAPGCISLFKELLLNSGGCLKTQCGFMQGVLDLKELLDLNLDPKPLILPPDLPMDIVFYICTKLTQVICKMKPDTSISRTIALENINTLYPEPD